MSDNIELENELRELAIWNEMKLKEVELIGSDKESNVIAYNVKVTFPEDYALKNKRGTVKDMELISIIAREFVKTKKIPYNNTFFYYDEEEKVGSFNFTTVHNSSKIGSVYEVHYPIKVESHNQFSKETVELKKGDKFIIDYRKFYDGITKRVILPNGKDGEILDNDWRKKVQSIRVHNNFTWWHLYRTLRTFSENDEELNHDGIAFYYNDRSFGNYDRVAIINEDRYIKDDEFSVPSAVACYWERGGSEGFYANIQPLYNNRSDSPLKRRPVMFIKCWDIETAEKFVNKAQRTLDRYV